MRLPKTLRERLGRRQSATSLSKYKVGQRSVELLQLADGHIHWVCGCEDYIAAAAGAQGPWCKHIAKASAIRSIERLTGARAITRASAVAADPGAAAAERADTAPAAAPH